MIHLINVKLPLSYDSAYHSVIIKNGIVKEIMKQSAYINDEISIPIGSKQFLCEITHEMPNQKKIDVQGRVMLPAFVDAHMHLDKAFSLAFASNQSGTLHEAIQSYYSILPYLSFENVKYRMLRAALQALSFGTTSIRTHIDFDTKLEKEVMFRGLRAALEVREQLKEYMKIQVIPMFPVSEMMPIDISMFEEAIEMNVDGIGGAPHLAASPGENIDHILKLAMKYKKPIDLHIDESDDPKVKTIKIVVEQAIKYKFQEKVVVGHLCSLSAIEEQEAKEIIQNIANARISVITLPSSNMYLQGRDDRGIVRRGTTRVRELYESGVPVALASDNVNDPFHPFGRCDLVLTGLLTSYAAHFGSPDDLLTLLKMITTIPASMIGLKSYGLAEGNKANFVILDAYSSEEIFIKIPERRWVYQNNHWTTRIDGTPIFQEDNLNKIWKLATAKTF